MRCDPYSRMFPTAIGMHCHLRETSASLIQRGNAQTDCSKVRERAQTRRFPCESNGFPTIKSLTLLP